MLTAQGAQVSGQGKFMAVMKACCAGPPHPGPEDSGGGKKWTLFGALPAVRKEGKHGVRPLCAPAC